MSKPTQHWLPSEQVPVGYNGTNEQLIQGPRVQAYYSTYSTAAPSELQGQPPSHQTILLAPYPGYGSHSITLVHPLIRGATHQYMTEEQDNMAPKHGHLPNQELADQSHLSFSGNELSTPIDIPWPFLIPSNGAAGPPTPSTTTNLVSQFPVRTSVTGLRVIELVAAENDLRAVGSPQIQQAARKRRKKDRNYQCPFRNFGCNSTFTAHHNLRYHLNAHQGLKPYKCSKCSYAADSPTSVKRHALKRHPSSCKVTGKIIKGTCEPESF